MPPSKSAAPETEIPVEEELKQMPPPPPVAGKPAHPRAARPEAAAPGAVRLARPAPGQPGATLRKRPDVPERAILSGLAPLTDNQIRHRERIKEIRAGVQQAIQTGAQMHAKVAALVEALEGADGGTAEASREGLDIAGVKNLLAKLDSFLDEFAPKAG